MLDSGMLTQCREDVHQAGWPTSLALRVDELTIEVDVELFVGNRNQGERVDGDIEVGEEAPGERQRCLFTTILDTVVNDEIHSPYVATVTAI